MQIRSRGASRVQIRSQPKGALDLEPEHCRDLEPEHCGESQPKGALYLEPEHCGDLGGQSVRLGQQEDVVDAPDERGNQTSSDR